LPTALRLLNNLNGHFGTSRSRQLSKIYPSPGL